jgi:hypothetical protein
MYAFSRLHHSPDAEAYYILKPMGQPEDEERFGPPHFATGGERGHWKRDHHLIGFLTVMHGNRRTLMFLSVKDGLTEEERQYLKDEVFLFAQVPDCSNAGHRGNVMQGWFMEESFFRPDHPLNDID